LSAARHGKLPLSSAALGKTPTGKRRSRRLPHGIPSKYISVLFQRESNKNRELILMQRKLLAAVLFLIWTIALSIPAVALAQGESTGATAQPKIGRADAKIASAVRAVLDAQAAAWNRGDIEGYMDGYMRSDDITFVSGDNLTRGWATVLARYKKSYDSREKMGQLSFSDLEIRPINKDSAVVLGRWQLTRANDTPHGRFTLIFRRTRAGWRIVHDHTS
jgi:beta-aspartyl-peptidase (threonine type)